MWWFSGGSRSRQVCTQKGDAVDGAYVKAAPRRCGAVVRRQGLTCNSVVAQRLGAPSCVLMVTEQFSDDMSLNNFITVIIVLLYCKTRYYNIGSTSCGLAF